MRILAVSDVQSLSLETLVENHPERFKNISLIISCGDLDKGYLEFLVDGINREFFFVSGNHNPEKITDYSENFKSKKNYIAGHSDMHGRVAVFRNYIIAGFAGSMLYNGKKNQYKEEEMAKIVNNTIRKIQWYRLRDKILGRPIKQVIVISHAPIFSIHDQPDVCHSGFKCFKAFIEKISPLLWLHGHIHLTDMRQNQISITGNTTVVNTFGCKVLEITHNNINVISHCSMEH